MRLFDADTLVKPICDDTSADEVNIDGDDGDSSDDDSDGDSNLIQLIFWNPK